VGCPRLVWIIISDVIQCRHTEARPDLHCERNSIASSCIVYKDAFRSRRFNIGKGLFKISVVA